MRLPQGYRAGVRGVPSQGGERGLLPPESARKALAWRYPRPQVIVHWRQFEGAPRADERGASGDGFRRGIASYPPRGGPASVSVTAPLCLIAGAATTIAMLHEEDESARFLANLGLPHLLIRQNGRIEGDADLASRARREHHEIGVPAVFGQVLR